MLYNTALVYLALVPIVSVRLLFPDYENRIVELAFLIVYNLATNLHFYSGKKGSIVLKSLVALLLCYGVSQVMSNLAVDWLSH